MHKRHSHPQNEMARKQTLSFVGYLIGSTLTTSLLLSLTCFLCLFILGFWGFFKMRYYMVTQGSNEILKRTYFHLILSPFITSDHLQASPPKVG